MTDDTTTTHATAIDPQDLAERQRAARALMLRPLLTAHGPDADDLRLVRRHQGELTKMFAEGLGYRLQVDPTSARLYKAGLGADPTRPLRRRSGAPFTPRAYAFLCLTVAALTRARSQLLVDELVQQVRSAAVDAGMEVDLDGVADRRSLHAALLVLVGHGVLRERDGDLEHWVDQRTQSLLDVRRDLLGQLVSAPLSAARSPGEVLEQAALPSAVGGARRETRRRLLESPLLTLEELPEEHAEWWRRNRNRERDWYDSRFGLQLELRAEGAVLVDPDDGFTDESFPGADKTRQLALLVLERLADTVASGGGGDDRAWRAIPSTTALDQSLEVHRTWIDRLRRDQREDPDGAVRDALEVLVRFGLVRRDGAQLLVHAAATRYAPQVTLAEASTTGERSLFDDTGDAGDEE
ncbi:TIGR02678 family protein [Ornithinimicrobium avium]|uniref:TIGR02678 family protein n=1 Tax=Ornithinimicrobium avium TaxID=2283195 RepID=A0A345NLY4_9MICO|nr:TIGR02678 family protein [Ornithinimicrobium avium]AXH96042.1 TIGR02678 family protein [Ornithinimicrobium avium]